MQIHQESIRHMLSNEERTRLTKEMLHLINIGSKDMPNHVFHYYEEQGISREQKPFYNLIADSFLTLRAFCVLMKESLWSQASAVLRMGIEQVSAVYVLAYQEGALAQFTDLMKEKTKFYNMQKVEQDTYAKEHRIKGRINEYFDYSWCKQFTPDNTYGRKQLMVLAHLEEFDADIENTLNAFTHGSISIFQFSHNNWEVMRIHGLRTSMCCCKLFDFLCCSYFHVVGIKNTNPYLIQCFEKFKIIYEYIFHEEGWK